MTSANNHNYSSPSVSIINKTQLSNLPTRDRKCIDAAINAAHLSLFKIPRKLGSCILLKGQYICVLE